MPTLQNHNAVDVKIPKSFQWVIEFMNRWYKENKDGELRLVYKSGGVTGLEEKQQKFHSPPDNS
ncbi:MAG: hypothetical protein ACFFDN_10785 [Candidatus Hodarchaeota archaeon]